MNKTQPASRRNLLNDVDSVEDPSTLDEAIEKFEGKYAAPLDAEAHEGRKPHPKLAGGGQLSVRLTGRITRYVEDRAARHGVSMAEVVRAMLNAQMDNEELLSAALRSAHRNDDQV